MENHLRNIVLTLFMLAAGMGAYAQDLPVVRSLSEALELKKNCGSSPNCVGFVVSYHMKS